MNLLISYHNFLVEALIFVVGLNILLQLMLKNNQIKYIQYTRIGYFTFWAVWAMAVFSGLVVFVFTKATITIPVLLMIIASIIVPIIDGYRAVKLGKLWRQEQLGLSFSIKLLFIEILILALVVVYTIVSR